MTVMRLLPLIFFLLPLGSALPASGATLSQEECINLATSRNSGLQSSAAASAAETEEINITQSALLPALTLKSFYTLRDKADRLIIDANAFGPGFPSRNTSISTGSTDSYGVQLSLRQPLFAGGALIAAHQRAGHESAATAHDYSRQRTLLVFQITKTYNEALIANNRIQAAEKAVQAAEKRLRVAVSRHNEGYVQRDALLRSEADLAMAQTRLIKSNNRSLLILARLKQLVGLKPEDKLNVSGTPAKLQLNATLQELTTGASDRREDISSLMERRAAAEAGIRQARSGFLPQVFLEGNYLRQKETSIAHSELWSLTLQAEWSLFEWGRTNSSVRKAVARHSSADLALEELKRAAILEIEEAYRDVIELQSLVFAKEKMLQAEEAALVRTIVRWSEGAARKDDVVTSEAVVWEAFDSYCQSAAALSSAFTALETATSGKLTQWTTKGDLYQPDFERYAMLIKTRSAVVPAATGVPETNATLPEHKIATLVAAQEVAAPSPKESKLFLANETGYPDDLDAVKKFESTGSPLPPDQHSGTPEVPLSFKGRYRLQLGAYLSEKRARETILTMSSRVRDHRIEIISEGKFFKLLAGPYATAEQAREAAMAMGISKFLVRSYHESR